MTDWQDRIIETRSGDPAELVTMLHPDNPKSHPEAQMEGIEHSLNKVGWIDRPIWNRHTNYFLDGNGRVKLALMAGQKSINYDVVDLSPEEEKYVLATFDALVGMAETDAVKLLALVNEVGEDLPEAVSEHLLGMMGGQTDMEGWDTAFGKLPDEERSEYSQMTFTLHASQTDAVNRALTAAKEKGITDDVNSNSNGNALTLICEVFITANGTS